MLFFSNLQMLDPVVFLGFDCTEGSVERPCLPSFLSLTPFILCPLLYCPWEGQPSFDPEKSPSSALQIPIPDSAHKDHSLKAGCGCGEAQRAWRTINAGSKDGAVRWPLGDARSQRSSFPLGSLLTSLLLDVALPESWWLSSGVRQEVNHSPASSTVRPLKTGAISYHRNK